MPEQVIIITVTDARQGIPPAIVGAAAASVEELATRVAEATDPAEREAAALGLVSQLGYTGTITVQ